MSQVVYFNNPSTITGLQTNVSTLQNQTVSLSGSISSLDISTQLLALRTQNVVPSVLDIFEEHKLVNNMPEFVGRNILNLYMMEEVNTFNVSKNVSYTGTEIYSEPAYKVYNYIQSGSNYNLTFTGGSIYNSSFTGMNISIHTPNIVDTLSVNYENIRPCAEPTIAYYISRGYGMPPADFIPEWNNIFYNGDSNTSFISIGLVVATGTTNITHVNLLARKKLNTLTPSHNLQVNPTSLNNFKQRTCQIPVTTTFSTYLTNKNSNIPTAFWDQTTKQITISYPASASAYTFYSTNVSFPTYNFYSDYVEKLTSFQGTFAMYKRDRLQKLALTNVPNEVECFIQVSPTLTFTNTISNSTGASLGTTSFSNPVMDTTTNKFIGFWIPKAGQGNSNFDIYSIRPGPFNGNASSLQPFLIPESSLNAEGDNSTTNIIEVTGRTSNFKAWDTTTFADNFYYVNPSVFETPVLYELMSGTFNGSELSKTVPQPLILSLLFSHELFHNVQFGQGSISSVDAEGQAVSIEMDQKLTRGNMFASRPSIWMVYLWMIFRGGMTIGQKQLVSGAIATNNPYDYLPTSCAAADYCNSVWYTYLRYSIDKNHQFMRRVNELCATKYYSPVLKSAGLEYATSLFFHPNACRLASQQAMQELFGLSIADVYTNFAIALSMLRANPSIPEQYRYNYPFWYWSRENPFNTNINLMGQYGDSWWWSDFDQSNPIKYNSPQTGAYFYWRSGQTNIGGQRRFAMSDESIIPTWPKVTSTGSLNYKASFTGPYATGPVSLNLEDLAMCGFVLPNALNSMTVNVVAGSSGACRAAVFKYSPIDSTGAFNISGPVNLTAGTPYTFNLTPYQSLSGFTKLVVVNTSVRDYGGINNCYITSIPYTAQVTMTATL